MPVVPASARYGSFQVRTQCRHCGQPLPLHGPVRRVNCSYCLQEVELGEELWRNILESFEERDEPLSEGERAAAVVFDGGLQVHLEVGAERPRCERCQAPFAVDELGTAMERNFACVQCGDPASTRPAPQWLQQHVPTVRQVYSTDPDTSLRDGDVSLAVPRDSPRPVVMSCPQCGGSLRVTEDTERILTCQYCQTDVYLPDDVWRRLHPVQTVQRWYLRFEGKTKRQQATEHRAQQAAEEAQRRAREEQARQTAQVLAERERDRQVDVLRRRAWWSTAVALGTMTIGIGINAAVATLGPGPATRLGLAAGTIMTSVALVLVGVHRAGKPIQVRTGYDKDWMVFCTWFYLPFVMLFPVIGTVFGVARAFVLARGKFAGATITSNQSSRSYRGTVLPHGEGRPAAALFAGLAVLWPLLVLSSIHAL